MEKINKEVRKCEKCPLSNERHHAVPGDGDVNARIMLIGEAPGRREDSTGKPFDGAAGKFLDELLAHAGLERCEVYITNTVKCRPPGNRKPNPAELAACRGYLEMQIRIIKPDILCLLGTVALESLLGEKQISRLHGIPVRKGGMVYLPLYHPAAAIYNRKLRDVMLSDLKRLGRLAEGRAKRTKDT